MERTAAFSMPITETLQTNCGILSSISCNKKSPGTYSWNFRYTPTKHRGEKKEKREYTIGTQYLWQCRPTQSLKDTVANKTHQKQPTMATTRFQAKRKEKHTARHTNSEEYAILRLTLGSVQPKGKGLGVETSGVMYGLPSPDVILYVRVDV